jgi:chemotaxis protein histidine kinase CheA
MPERLTSGSRWKCDSSPEDRMTELRQLFFETAAELVQKLNEAAHAAGTTPRDAETARSLRRTVHTLKGDAAACGFRELSELAHEFEDVLALENPAAPPPRFPPSRCALPTSLRPCWRLTGKARNCPSIESLRAEIAHLAHPADSGAAKSKSKARQTLGEESTSRWSEYEQLAIAQAVSEGKRVHHVVVEIDPQCGMPIAARQMIQLALAGLGEVLALYPAEGGHEPIIQVAAALASDKPAEQIRAKCSIPTITLNVKTMSLRGQAPTRALPPASAGDFEGADSQRQIEVAPTATGVKTEIAACVADRNTPAPANRPRRP